MIRRIALIAAAFSMALIAPGYAQEADSTGADAVAERLARMAQITLTNKNLSDETWKQASSLLEGACRLAPKEPRFFRLLADANLQIKDSDRAIAALESYLKLKPGDQLAQVQLIDLYLAKMQSADERLNYLEPLVDNAAVAPEVRACVAVRAAKLYLDRAQQQQADEMIARAMTLNKYDPEVCRMELDRAIANGSLPERINALLALLRSNPAQQDVMVQLAAELAHAGMTDQSQRWYARAFETAQRAGQPLNPQAYLDATAGSIIAGQSKTAEGKMSGFLQSQPDNYDAMLLKLLAIKRVGTEEQTNAANDGMLTLLANRTNDLHRAMTGSDAPSTQPTGEMFERLPDIAADAAQLKDKPGELRELYAETLANLAWQSAYFTNKPADTEKVVAALREILPADSVVLARIEGWSLLMQGKNDEAKAKLAAVADRDPLAQMGMIKLLIDKDQKAAMAQGQTLINENPAGLLGAIIVSGLKELELHPEPTADAQVIRDALDKFPMKWLDILEKPSDFYTLTAGVERVQYPFGKPMLATVTIKNTSEFDIPFGPGATLRPDLWVDCTIKGSVQQPMPGVAFDRMGGKMVLRRNEAVEHVLRVDQGQLWALQQSRPDIPFPLYFSVFTNPVPSATIAAPGPAGYRAQFKKPVERIATPLFAPQQREAIFKQLALGDAGQKIALHELFAQYIGLMSRAQDVDTTESSQVLRQAVEQSMSEAEPITRAWASYVTTLLESEPRRSQLAIRLANSPDWVQRLLLLTFAEALQADVRDTVLSTLSEDKDEIIKRYAVATREIIAKAPATQPSDAGPVGAGN